MNRFMNYVALLNLLTYVAILIAGCSSIKESYSWQAKNESLKDTTYNKFQDDGINELRTGNTEYRFHDTLLVNDFNSRPDRTSTMILNIVQPDKADSNGNSIVYVRFPYMDNPVVTELQTGFYNSTVVDFNYNYWNIIGFDQDGNSNTLESTFYGYDNSAHFHQFGTYNSISTHQAQNSSVSVSQNGNNNTVKIVQ